MKKILIKKMKILNFKGISELIVDFSGNNVSVFGANGVGKTTLVDAFCWCLWGKDSRNQADFDIKPIINGVSMSKAEHIVELVLQNGDKEISFERTFAEKWTKPRGALEFEFKGHETKYKVNNEPITLRQYNDVVSTLVDSKVFALLSNPLYFNENLKWEERRELLMKLAGDISVADIVKNNAKIADLAVFTEAEIMTKKKIADAQASKIRKEIADIPIRISELQRTMHKSKEIVSNSDYMDAQNVIEKLKREIMILSKNRGEILATPFDENEELKTLNQQLLDLKAMQQQKRFDESNILKARLDAAYKTLNMNKQNLQGLLAEQDNIESKLKKCELHREILLEKYETVKQQEMSKPNIMEVCPVCEQKIPDDAVQKSYQKYEQQRKEFNVAKSKQLNKILEDGNANNKLIEQYKLELDGQLLLVNNAQEWVANAQEDYNTALKSFNDFTNTLADSQAIIDLKAKIAKLANCAIESKILFQQQLNKQIESIDEEIQQKNQEMQKILIDTSQYENSVKIRNRIEELEAEESVLNQAHEEHRIMSWKCEQFILSKINYINNLILDKFNMANFVLFRKNISNDGIEQCCDTLVNDVPYKSINDAARINVGMDIISTFIDYYGVAVPIFVDNAESVTDLNMINGKTQIIRLVVSKDDTTLRFVKE